MDSCSALEETAFVPDRTTGNPGAALTIMLVPCASVPASSQQLTQKKSSVATPESTVQRTGKSPLENRI